MAKLNLDKYYTSPELAKRCIDIVWGLNLDISETIEPSAGNGSFSLQIPDCIAYDLEPEHESIIQQDFLTLNLSYKPGRLFIGNPPFGNGNKLSVKFYKHCVRMGDYIAFILPISQLNNNVTMYEFDLIYSEDLGKTDYSDRSVHCCFNVYKRPLYGLNKQPNFDLNEVSLRGVNRGNSRNDKVPTEYDFSISAFGSSIGKICEYEYQYCSQIYVTVHKKQLKERIYNFLKNVNWMNLYDMTTSPKLNHWMVNRYLKECIPELTFVCDNQPTHDFF